MNTLFQTGRLFLLALLACSVARAETAPNVVLIISDDQAWTDYGFMGHEVIKTPRLDQLARESAVFTRGYVPSSLCRPSLMTMITGLYPFQHHVTGNDPARGKGAWDRALLLSRVRDLPTVPRLLGERGYVSFQSGKWWEGNYRLGGFTGGMTHGDPTRGGRHGDEGLKIGREGLQPIFDFLAEADADEKPFFLWYAPFLPHRPHNPPERLLEKYTAPGRSVHTAKYYAMCQWFDETCGELLDYLDEHDLSENTLVVYACDNGWIQLPDQSGYAPRSKRSPNEGGIRTPILFRWPGHIEPRRDETTLVHTIDLAPTMLAACGMEAPEAMPGENLLPVCSGQPLQRSAIFGDVYTHDIAELENPLASLRHRWCIEGDWKLIVDYRTGAQELYHLADDPTEQTNLAANEPKMVVRLEDRLQAFWKAEGGE